MAIAGFPLLNGFVSKSLIMNAAAESGIHWAELGLMIASVGTLMSVTLKINYFVFWGKSDVEVTADEAAVPLGRKLAMGLAALGCFACGILPNFVYGLTPFMSDGHPFTVDHVTQYMELFAAAGIAFLMYLDHMKPHDQLSLDVDWLYRKPLPALIRLISTGFDKIRTATGSNLGRLIASGNRFLHNPRSLAEQYFGMKPAAKRDCLEDDDVLQKPAGWLVATNFIIFLAVVLFVFYNVR
jgi:multicomponent Na+:H+ antiporter subunit D